LTKPERDDLVALATRVLDIESRAVRELIDRLDATFADACRLCLEIDGRVVVTGMGKSGHVGGKIAATLASTGTPAFFMHPAEASHGDLGMITPHDLLLAVSYSGETNEVVTILPLVKRMGAKLVSMTGKPGSTLARAADVHLDVSVSVEACPLNLAPTASTTATLAMGDAMAVALLESRGLDLRPEHLHFTPVASPGLSGDAALAEALPFDLDEASLKAEWLVLDLALARCGGVMTEAVKMLGTTRNRAYRILNQIRESVEPNHR